MLQSQKLPPAFQKFAVKSKPWPVSTLSAKTQTTVPWNPSSVRKESDHTILILFSLPKISTLLQTLAEALTSLYRATKTCSIHAYSSDGSRSGKNDSHLWDNRKRREQNTRSYTRLLKPGKTNWETFIFFWDVYLKNPMWCVYGNLRYLEDCEVLKAAVAMERAVFALYSIAQYLITEILIKLCILTNRPFYRSLLCTYYLSPY